MITKILSGGLLAALVALGIVFALLLNAKEANGSLKQGIQTADDINLRQSAVLDEVQANHDNLLVQIDQQRIRMAASAVALGLTQEKLVTAGVDFNQRIRDALSRIPDEELACAAEFVPAGLINSLHVPAGGFGGP